MAVATIDAASGKGEGFGMLSMSPGTVGATASSGAPRRDIGIADTAFDQILGGQGLSPLLLGTLAPP